MTLHRFFIDFDQAIRTDGELRVVDSALAHQLQKVLRKKLGDQIILLDGKSNEYLSEVRTLTSKFLIAKILKSSKNKNEPELKITLCPSLIKSARFEWMLEKGTEIGVSAFTPVLTSRSEAKNFKKDRALKIIKEAAEQCERGLIPKINEYLETNRPDILVAGDAAEFYHPIFEDKLQFGGWTGAQLQGKTAALNMIGKKETFKWVPFYTTSAFGISITFAGDIRPLPDRIIIPRGAGNSYGRIIIKGNRIVGATLINRNQELAPILKLIENKTDISKKQKELADPNFDLKNL